MKRFSCLFLLTACLQFNGLFAVDGWRSPVMRRLNPTGYYSDRVTGQLRRSETNTSNQVLLARKRKLEALEDAHLPTTSSDQQEKNVTTSFEQNSETQEPEISKISFTTSLTVAPSRDELNHLVTVVADKDAIRDVAQEATVQIESREQHLENSRNNDVNK